MNFCKFLPMLLKFRHSSLKRLLREVVINFNCCLSIQTIRLSMSGQHLERLSDRDNFQRNRGRKLNGGHRSNSHRPSWIIPHNNVIVNIMSQLSYWYYFWYLKLFEACSVEVGPVFIFGPGSKEQIWELADFIILSCLDLGNWAGGEGETLAVVAGGLTGSGLVNTRTSSPTSTTCTTIPRLT